MAAEVITAPEGRIIHKTYAVLSGAAIPQRVHVTQYDESLPVIACTLYKDGQLYTIPDGASVRLRMNKNGLPVYHEAMGIDDARHVVYLEITTQMTVLYGEFAMVLEVETSDGKTAGTSYLRLIVRQNPVQNPELDNIPDYTANSNKLTAEGVKKLQDESSKQQKAIEDKGKNTLESIPADYSTLSGKVDENTSGISQLKSDLYNVENLEKKRIADRNVGYVIGAIYYAQGIVQMDVTDYRTTDYIDISYYDYFYVTMVKTASFVNWGLCFYDENKTYISGIAPNTSSEAGTETRKIERVQNAKYIRVSYRVIDWDSFLVSADYELKDTIERLKNIVEPLDGIASSAEYREHSRNWFDATKATLTSESGVKGYLSDFIPVKEGDVLYASSSFSSYSAIGMSLTSFFLVRFYNSNKQNISNSDYWKNSVTVPNGVSYARCYVGRYNDAKIMIEKNTRTDVWEEYWDSGYIANDVKARNTSDIAIDSFLYGSVSMFDRIGAIGDSFTEGYAKASDGTYNTNKDHSYIGVMAKRAGINYANYGHSGATTRSYLTDKLPAVLADSTCDFYFIALGINDVGLGASYIGTVADINDDYTQNADTFYGNYGKIIAQVKAHSPKALFCLIKIPLCGENVKEFSSAIEEIGQHFGIPVINPYDDEFFKTDVYENMNDGHPTLLGYTGMALAYERLLSKAIYDNPTYFKFATIG